MTAATLAPSLNGVIKIAKRSLQKFQFGDDEPIVTLDVIAIADEWHETNFALRVLENGMWVVPANKVNEHAVNRLNFVQAIVNAAYDSLMEPRAAPTLTRGDAEEFVNQVREATETLRNFIYPKSAETLSAPESTDRGTDFSQ